MPRGRGDLGVAAHGTESRVKSTCSSPFTPKIPPMAAYFTQPLERTGRTEDPVGDDPRPLATSWTSSSALDAEPAARAGSWIPIGSSRDVTVPIMNPPAKGRSTDGWALPVTRILSSSYGGLRCAQQSSRPNLPDMVVRIHMPPLQGAAFQRLLSS
jgi:hypothetical protein